MMRSPESFGPIPSTDIASEYADLADDLNAGFVPYTEIAAIAEALPPEAVNYLRRECGWDNDPEIVELLGHLPSGELH